jgi:hypothetical protein
LKPELSERQQYWLAHIRKAEQRGEPLKHYAQRLGLASSSLYEAKRRLRELGEFAPATEAKPVASEFVRVAVASRPPSARLPFQVRFASGAVFEWSEAPQGEALRELVGLVS